MFTWNYYDVVLNGDSCTGTVGPGGLDYLEARDRVQAKLDQDAAANFGNHLLHDRASAWYQATATSVDRRNTTVLPGRDGASILGVYPDEQRNSAGVATAVRSVAEAITGAAQAARVWPSHARQVRLHLEVETR